MKKTIAEKSTGISIESARRAVEKSMLSSEEIGTLMDEWCKKSHAPALEGNDRQSMEELLRNAVSTPRWRDEFRATKRDREAEERTRRVADALRTLRKDLPDFIEDWRSTPELFSVYDTSMLLECVNRHQPFIDRVETQGRGAPQSAMQSLASAISDRVSAIWGGQAQKAAADIFAAEAIAWLTGFFCPVSPESIRKARGRRQARN